MAPDKFDKCEKGPKEFPYFGEVGGYWSAFLDPRPSSALTPYAQRRKSYTQHLSRLEKLFLDVIMPQNALQNIVTGRKVLLRDRLPRHLADAVDRLPIPRIFFPVLNIYPYPDTHPDYNPRKAAQRILSRTNSYRRRHGKRTLRLSITLCDISRRHSEDQAKRRVMTHTGAQGSSLGDRLARGGYRYRTAGENVAFGYTSEDHVFEGWRTSPGHRSNLLKDGVNEMGAWVVEGRDGLYWTQVVARRR